MKNHSELLCLVLMVFTSASAYAGERKTYESTCGAAKFRVVSQNNGHPLDNKFTLSALTPSGAKTLFIGDDGGWFHAACLPARNGRPLLVFQSYCSGSACLEGKYGAVDPQSLAVLLRPSSKNVENDKALAKLLGSAPPHLGSLQGAFCCSK